MVYLAFEEVECPILLDFEQSTPRTAIFSRVYEKAQPKMGEDQISSCCTGKAGPSISYAPCLSVISDLNRGCWSRPDSERAFHSPPLLVVCNLEKRVVMVLLSL